MDDLDKDNFEEIGAANNADDNNSPVGGDNPEPSEKEEVTTEQIDLPGEEAEQKKVSKSFLKTLFGRILLWLLFFSFVFLSFFVLPGFLQKAAVKISLNSKMILSAHDDSEMADDKAILEASINKLDKQLESYMPKLPYMIINSTDNEFTLKNRKDVVRSGKCSTGSYVILEDEKNNKKWLFKTPKGVRKILGKKTDPVWTKPDWAFKEEGLPVPSPNHPSRFEEGVLGDYALNMGNGYMIHGTIWQRYLGLPVTHGCVRLNDTDLEVVYKTLQKGSNVYIY